MEIEEKIRLHKELSKKIHELEEQKKAIGLEIMEKMESKTLEVPGYLVRKYSRLFIKTTLDEARVLDAIKLEEVVDKDKIKTLYLAGQVNGISEIQYIQVMEGKGTKEIIPTN